MIYRYTIPSFAFALIGANASFAATDGHEEKVHGLPQMDPTWFASQLFWLGLMFVVLYLVFGRIVLPALSGTIENRRERIQSDLDQARTMKDDAQNVLEEYEKLMADAHKKASDLFSQMDQDVKRKTNNETAKIQKKAVDQIQKTENKIQGAKNKALEDMDKIAAETARLAVEKIVGVTANAKEAASIVEKLGKKAA